VPADAAEEHRAEGVGAHLAGEIHLQRRVDRDHVVVLGDEERIVRVLRRVHLDDRVVVDEFIQLAAAGGEAADDLAGIEHLFASGNHAAFGQLADAVGEHLRVDAEVVLVRQAGEDGVGDPPDAELQGRAVAHEPRDVVGDPAGHVVELLVRPLQQGLRLVHEVVDPVDVDEGVAQCARHFGVYLGDHDLGGFRCRLRDVHRHAVAAVPVLVRRRDADQRYVDGHAAAAEERRHLREEDGRVVRAAVADGIPQAVADEERIRSEAVRVARLRVRRDAQRQHVDDFRIGEVLPEVGQRPHELLRLAARRPDEHTVTPPDVRDGVLRRRQLARVSFLPPGCLRHHGLHLILRRLPACSG